MKPGELTGQGTLFLRANPYTARTRAGDTVHTLMCVERRGAGVQHLTALWSGPAADSFMHQHAAALKPGKGIAFTFSRFWVLNNELHATVYTASLAPDRWQDHIPARARAAAESTENAEAREAIDNPASAPAPL